MEFFGTEGTLQVGLLPANSRLFRKQAKSGFRQGWNIHQETQFNVSWLDTKAKYVWHAAQVVALVQAAYESSRTGPDSSSSESEGPMAETIDFSRFDFEYKPRLGKKIAYQIAGFRVSGLWNRTVEIARAVATRFDVANVFSSWQELISSRDIEVVDISLPPHLQPEVAIAAAAGKHIMIQKPMAVTYGDALRIVAAARENGVKLAVNQNGRWDPAIRACGTLISRGLLGTRLTAFIELRTMQPWQRFWEDRAIYTQLMILGMSVHHLDQFRFLFGEPEYVTAITDRYPGQKWEGESIAHYQLQYGDGFFASGLDAASLN